MVAPTLLQSIQELSIADKLALIEAITQMLQNELQSRPYTNGSGKQSVPVTESTAVKSNNQDMQALIAELFSRPDPTPEQMLPRGLLKGIRFDEEDFRAAEWHPSEKELSGE